jgi:hypothetical protein
METKISTNYLLDVNVLVALGLLQHEFHERVASWVRTLASREFRNWQLVRSRNLASSGSSHRHRTMDSPLPTHGRSYSALKTGNSLKFTFISDDHDVSHIPAWVKTARQTTDGHLVQLAKAKSAILSTLDESIPEHS